MTNLRVGFIGAGRHASNIVYPSLRYAPIDLVAVAALGEEETLRAARNFGAQRYYVGGFEEMLRRNATTSTPSSSRSRRRPTSKIILSLPDAGLPVYAEKPAAGSVAEAVEIEQKAQRAGLPVQVGFMKRFAPAYKLAKAAMARATFGRPTNFVGKFGVGPGLYPDEYTYLVDNPIHLIDLARFFMGDVASVSVQRGEWGEKRWTYAVLLRFASGAVGTLHLANTQSWRQHNEYVEITGLGHFVSVDNVTRYHYRPPDGPGEYWEPNPTVPSAQNASVMLTGYAHELIAFADVVQNGAQPLATITDARKALELIDEIYRQGGGVIEAGKTASVW